VRSVRDPIGQLEAFDAAELAEVVANKRGSKGKGMACDPKIVGTDGSATTFECRGQLDQMEAQYKQADQSSRVTLSQRRFAGSGGAVLLIIAFTILCLGSVL
jgi:hypothetical protein